MIVQLVRWCFKPMPKNTADGGRNPPSRSRFRVHHNVRRSASAVTENCKDNKREDSPQTDTEDDHSILRREVEAAVQSLKRGKPARVANTPAELVPSRGRGLNAALMTVWNKTWQTGEWVNNLDPRKATGSSTETTEWSVPSVNQAKSC